MRMSRWPPTEPLFATTCFASKHIKPRVDPGFCGGVKTNSIPTCKLLPFLVWGPLVNRTVLGEDIEPKYVLWLNPNPQQRVQLLGWITVHLSFTRRMHPVSSTNPVQMTGMRIRGGEITSVLGLRSLAYHPASFPGWGLNPNPSQLGAIPENREFKKWKFSFFHQRHALWMSFVVTYRVTNLLPKLVDMLLFSMEKTEFPFLVFPYFRVMPPIGCNS